MKKLISAAVAVLFAGAAPVLAAPKAAKKPKVLYFTKSAGFQHGVVKAEADGDSHSSKVMKRLAEANGWELDHTKDGTVFAQGLANHDVFVLFTTGDLTKEGTDKTPAWPAGTKEAFFDTIRKGKGFVGIHAATDTFHGPSGEEADPYIKFMGGEFLGHGPVQPARLFCTNPRFPGQEDCPKEGFVFTDEWYSLKNIAKDMHVLQWLATWTLKNTENGWVYRRAPYPITWTRTEGKGRVFYTGMGHTEQAWDDPIFQKVLVGGVRWAAGAVKATVKPNIAQVTPWYDQLPVKDPPAPKPAAAAPAPSTPGLTPAKAQTR